MDNADTSSFYAKSGTVYPHDIREVRMLNLNQTTLESVQRYGHDLFIRYRTGLGSLEQAANTLVNTLGTDLVNAQGRPISALIRIFYGCPYDQLPSHYQGRANPQTPFWLALMATAGIEAAWCHPLQSQHHQVIPVDNSLKPMFQAAFAETALEVGVPARDDLPTNLSESGLTKVFFMADAVNHPSLFDQQAFIQPYGIQSVAGIGNTFITGSGFLLMLFSQTALNPSASAALSTLAPYVATLMAAYHGRGVIWS